MLTLAFDNDLIPVIAIVGGITVALVAIVFGTVKSMLDTRAREATKREIAAYVAEGSISPDDAERLIKADSPRPPGCSM
jgi:hypothetical protein